MANLNEEDKKDIEDFKKKVDGRDRENAKIECLKQIATALTIIANKLGRKLR